MSSPIAASLPAEGSISLGFGRTKLAIGPGIAEVPGELHAR